MRLLHQYTVTHAGVTIRRSILNKILSRSLSTAVDKAKDSAPETNYFRKAKDPNKFRVVILGTGWGGYKFLHDAKKHLREIGQKHDPDSVEIFVVSARNHFTFTPLLASTTVGTLEFRSIIEPVRYGGSPFFRDESHMYLANATSVEPSKDTVYCESTFGGTKYAIEYDALLVAVGADTNTFNIPGVQEHAFFLKEVWHARAIRQRILGNIELATQPGISTEEKKRLAHFVVVGGGPTGVEFCAELYDFVTQDVTKICPEVASYVQVSLIEAREVLGAFDGSLRAFAVGKMSQRKNMQIIKNNAVEVGPESITLDDGRELPCGLVVWSAGIQPRKLIKSLPWEKAPNGTLLVNDFLQVKGSGSTSLRRVSGQETLPEGVNESNIFAIGDCCQVDGSPLPQTAQVAQSQAEYLAKMLPQLFEGKPLKPYNFHNKGIMAYVGDYNALTQLGDAELLPGKKVHGPRMKGLLSWILWRSVYMTRLGSWRLRMQVPIDWFKSFFLGRDTSSF